MQMLSAYLSQLNLKRSLQSIVFDSNLWPNSHFHENNCEWI